MAELIERGAVKVIEIIGVSPDSFDDAVEEAVKKAAETIRAITGVEVVRQSGRVRDGRIVQYRVDCRIAFPVQ